MGDTEETSTSPTQLSANSLAVLLWNNAGGISLVAVTLGMLWVRLKPYGDFVTDRGVFFSGTDAWYHYRHVQYTVRNWPATLSYDVWTNFPTGTDPGQFGTLFDQLVATIALIVGLGDPSPQLVATVLAVTPAVAGALTAVPVYLVGRQVTSQKPAIFGAVVLALIPGIFLQRTFVGAADHNSVEPLFQVGAVLLYVLAIQAAERTPITWRVIASRNWTALKRPTVYSLAAGVATALYILVWPPGVLLIGILGVYAVFQQVTAYAGGESGTPVAFVLTVAMGATATITGTQIEVWGFDPEQLSLAHPLLALAVAIGTASLAAMGRAFASRGNHASLTDKYAYPITVGSLTVIGLTAVGYIDYPALVGIRYNLSTYLGFSVGAELQTVGEARPFLRSSIAALFGTTGAVISEYGITFIAAIAGVCWTVARSVIHDNPSKGKPLIAGSVFVLGSVFAGNILPVDILAAVATVFPLTPEVLGTLLIWGVLFALLATTRQRSELLLVVVWTGILTMAAFTQVRFNYYLAPAVAICNAIFIARVMESIGLRSRNNTHLPNPSIEQTTAVVAVVVVVLAPVLVLPVELGPNGAIAGPAPAVANGEEPGEVVIWTGSLDWMANNTPPVGTLGGETNRLDLYGTPSTPADGNFDYPAGAYGVMSWWDYGHWITARGERIPIANPFQEGATQAGNFFIAGNETEATRTLSTDTDAGQTRYVIVDWRMATASKLTVQSKFRSMLLFADRTRPEEAYFEPIVGSDGDQYVFSEHKQAYYESMAVRLYYYHGSRANSQLVVNGTSQVVVFDWEVITSPEGTEAKAVPQAANESAFKTFPNRSAAKAFVRKDGTAKIGGIGLVPNQPVAALEHYRLVHASTKRATRSSGFIKVYAGQALAVGAQTDDLIPENAQWVKTFEKVPGATVHGTGAPPNTTITATVQLRISGTAEGADSSTFTYTQQTMSNSDGEFHLTLPYSTTGYDNYGPSNGYTNVSVRATGPYTITWGETSNQGSAKNRTVKLTVPESIVNGDQNQTLTIDLRETTGNLTSPQDSTVSPAALTPQSMRFSQQELTEPMHRASTNPVATPPTWRLED